MKIGKGLFMSTRTLELNSTCPAFSMKAVDGKNYSLKSFNNKKALVIIFSCNHCPYVQAYEERIKGIQNDYAAKGVQVIAVNSNDKTQHEDDSFEGMIERARTKIFNFPYLRDEDQSVAKAFDASHTPEIFLFDENRKLKYHGKIDDNWKDEDMIRSFYLRDALDELLEGKDISVPETFSIGCTIKWKPENMNL